MTGNKYKEVIREVWAHYLRTVEKNNKKPFEGYRVSGVGGCLLKHLHGEEEAERVDADDSLINLNTGTMLHASREAALTEMNDMFMDLLEAANGQRPVEVHQEITLRDEENGLIGHADIIVEYENYFDILDDKFLNAFRYSKVFAREKKNRDPNALDNYKMQMIQYALMFEKQSGKPLRRAIIMVGKKNDMKQRPVEVYKKDWLEPIKEYWEELKQLKFERERFGVMPGVREKVPVHGWECNYCSFSHLCYPNEVEALK